MADANTELSNNQLIRFTPDVIAMVQEFQERERYPSFHSALIALAVKGAEAARRERKHAGGQDGSD